MASSTQVRAGLANLRSGNEGRARVAARRDREVARNMLWDRALGDCPPRWVAVAKARADSPESASWADIADEMGLTKYQVTSIWHRLTRSLGYMPRQPSDGRHIKDRAGDRNE